MGQRHPDGAAVDVGVAVDDLPERGMHRRLGDAVHVDHARHSRVVVQPGPKTLWLKRFAAEHHSLKLQLLSQLGL